MIKITISHKMIKERIFIKLPMKIGIDLDDTLADFTDTFLRFHNQRYQTTFSNQHITTYELEKVLGGSKDDLLEKFKEFNQSLLAKSIRPLQGAQKNITYLAKRHELYIITARPSDTKEQTRLWIKTHFGGQFREIFYASTTQKRSKGDIGTEVGIGMMIDDSLMHATDCVTKGIRTLLYNHPWNQALLLPSNMERIYSWDEILQKILSRDRNI